MGLKFTFSADRVTYGEDICEQPYYKKQTISSEDMIIGYKVAYETLGIDSDTSIQMIEIYEGRDNWKGDMGSCFFVKDENTLIVWNGGIFLEAKRVE